MAKVIWSPRAVKDIAEIAEYIAKDSLLYAKAQTRLFLEQGEKLEDHPYRGRVVQEIGIDNIRQKFYADITESSMKFWGTRLAFLQYIIKIDY